MQDCVRLIFFPVVFLIGACNAQLYMPEALPKTSPPPEHSIREPVPPTGWAYVPPDSNVGTDGFFVMKYEATEVGGIPTSAVGQTPTVGNQLDAVAACASLGADYDLISNAQWQALARNIESVAANWSDGDPASTTSFLNLGNASSDYLNVLPSGDDSDPCSQQPLYQTAGTGSPCTTWEYKRTHVLTNGQTIWDVAGNAWEWVKDPNSTVQGGPGLIKDEPWNAMGTGTFAGIPGKLLWGPFGSYAGKPSPQEGGLGGTLLHGTSGAIVRGGHYGDGAFSGVFAVLTFWGPSDNWGYIGYRCVQQIP